LTRENITAPTRENELNRAEVGAKMNCLDLISMHLAHWPLSLDNIRARFSIVNLPLVGDTRLSCSLSLPPSLSLSLRAMHRVERTTPRTFGILNSARHPHVFGCVRVHARSIYAGYMADCLGRGREGTAGEGTEREWTGPRRASGDISEEFGIRG